MIHYFKSTRLALAIILLVSSISTRAQDHQVKGRILDEDTREPLAFVNILINDGPSGTATDIDGKFLIRYQSPVLFLKISYVGYDSKVYKLSPGTKDQVILIKKKETELPEVVIKPGINPANRIIRKVLENRLLNDHERMESFSYTTYEKFTLGPDKDSISWTDLSPDDTSALRTKEFFDRQYLFLMESVTERKYMHPDKNYNKVIASRISGFSDPLFVFMMSQLQSTSFYKEVIKISDKEYINPISKGTLSKYYFELQDTLVEPYPYDTTFIMTFRPLLNTNFDGLTGVISISTNNFAIRNVIAQPARNTGTMTIKIQQLYDYLEGQHWFPSQLNTDIIFQGAIGKGTVSVGIGSGSAPDSTRHDLVGRGKSYIRDVKLNPEFRKNQFSFVEVDVQAEAYHQPDALWNEFRIDSLSRKDQNTYHILDSLGKAINLDRKGYVVDALLNGRVPIGALDLDLRRLLRFNRYEGLRAGLGLNTNSQFSNLFQLGGYGAYGIKDKAFKYGGDFNIVLDPFRDATIGFFADDDVNEAGVDNPFEESKNLLDNSRYRQLLIDRMDHTIRQGVKVSGRLMKYAYLEASLLRYYIAPSYNYSYVTQSNEQIWVSHPDFKISEISLTLRYAYGEKFIRNTRSILSLGTRYPIVSFHYSRGINDFLDGKYLYNRLMMKAEKTISFKYLGKTTLTLYSGITDRDVPYPLLFNSLSDHSDLMVSLYSYESFATMRMNEFVADKFASLFISHNFGRLLFRSKYFSPKPELLTNIGFGSLSHPENHLGIEVKDYRKGYLESGLLLNSILNAGISSLGFGAFYRYGYYAFPDWKDNFSLKLTVGVNL